MAQQFLPKSLVVAGLIGAWWVTWQLLRSYIDAVTGQLQGAGAAQWQFAFSFTPLPAFLSTAAYAISRRSHPRLNPTWRLAALLSAALPLLLLVLVLLHVY